MSASTMSLDSSADLLRRQKALTSRFEYKKQSVKYQLNTLVDNLFGFLLSEISSCLQVPPVNPLLNIPATVPNNRQGQTNDSNGHSSSSTLVDQQLQSGESSAGFTEHDIISLSDSSFPDLFEVEDEDENEPNPEDLLITDMRVECTLQEFEGQSALLNTSPRSRGVSGWKRRRIANRLAKRARSSDSQPDLNDQEEDVNEGDEEDVEEEEVEAEEEEIEAEEEEEETNQSTEGYSQRGENRPRRKNRRLKVLGLKCWYTGCDRMLNCKASLMTHLSDVHNTYSYRCQIADCNRAFPDRRQLTKHHQAIHDTLESFQCSQCPKRFSSYASFHTHFIQTHEEGIFGCPQATCAFTAPYQYLVLKHFRKSHNNFICEICGQMFERIVYLRCHQSVHTRIRPYRCTYPGCKFASSQHGATIQHIRTVHFRLPRSQRMQKELNIIDDRDPNQYLQVHTELL